MKIETSQIVFEDGRRGTQTVEIHADGTRELSGIVVTRNDLGQACRHVYDRHPDLQAKVFSLSDLGNGAKWDVVPGSVTVKAMERTGRVLAKGNKTDPEARECSVRETEDRIEYLHPQFGEWYKLPSEWEPYVQWGNRIDREHQHLHTSECAGGKIEFRSSRTTTVLQRLATCRRGRVHRRFAKLGSGWCVRKRMRATRSDRLPASQQTWPRGNPSSRLPCRSVRPYVGRGHAGDQAIGDHGGFGE